MRKGENSIKTLIEHGRELYEQLRLKTLPLAIKMLENKGDIPHGAVRPKRDLGYHLASCQAFAMSRREGTLMAMLKEDMWCSEAVIGYGLGEVPQFFFDGYTRFPQEVESLEAGSTWAHEFPRFAPGKYIGVVSAPLTTVNFVPDVVVIYCDSAQLKMLNGTMIWKYGQGINCTINNCGACVHAVVPTMKSGKCNITLPCGGDRAYAMCQDNEMIFTAPVSELKNVVQGLRHLDIYNNRVPIPFVMRPEFPMRESYVKVGKMLGMDMEKAEVLGDKKYV